MSTKIPREFIDELLARIDIVEIINSRLSLKKAGKDFKACCPFHNENTPSFTVSQSKQFYHCFGCNANGSAISFLMDFESLSFPEAIEELANTAGMQIPQTKELNENKDSVTPELLESTRKAETFFKEQLRNHGEAKVAIDYLKSRGITGKTASSFHIGFAPPEWDSLVRSALGDEITLKNMEKSGLINKKKSGGFYDRFRSRVIFPIHNHKGKVIAFGGRILGEGEPKYLNSPETAIFHKGTELYNLNRARSHISKSGFALMVEGYMDVIALDQHEIRNSVAALGTAITTTHIQRLFRIAPTIIFCLDGDEAGRSAAWRALEISLSELSGGKQISFIFLPEGDDPDTFVNREGKEQFDSYLEKAISLPDFLFNSISKKPDLGRIDGKARMVELAKPLLAKIPKGPLSELMYRQLSEKTGVHSLSNETNPNTEIKPNKKNFKSRRLSPIATAISLLLQNPSLAKLQSLPTNAFSSKEESEDQGRQMLKEIYEIIRQNPELTTASLVERFRQTNNASYLQKLAYKDHHLKEEDFEPFFSETLDTIEDQFLANSIDSLLSQFSIEELDEQQKNRLSSLYNQRAALRKNRQER